MKHRGNNTGKRLVGYSGGTRVKVYRNATFPITDLTWTALRLKPGQRGEKLMINSLPHGTAYVKEIKSKTNS